MRRDLFSSISYLVLIMLTAGLAGNSSSFAQSEPARLIRGADVVLLNGKIWTGELPPEEKFRGDFGPRIEAVAISNGRFLALGTNEEIKAYISKNTKIIDLGGRLALPGFIDDHTHFINGGFQLLTVDLKDARSEAEFVKRLAQKAKTLPTGRWIQGGDWDEEAWPDAKLPTRWMIDAVTPDNPVFISRYDGHASLANSLALKLAGVSRETKDVPGGVIVRDARTGEPTGVFKDAAESLIDKAIPRPTEAEFEEALKAGLAEARRVGVTSVDDISVGSDSPNGSFTGEIHLLRKAELEGWLTCRFYEITPIADWKRLAEAGISHDMGSNFLRLGAVKAFADGSLGSRTAWMYEPFTDDPGNRGLPMPIMDPPSRMEEEVRGAVAAGIQPAVHAIGDRANAEMLDIFERVGGADPAAYRFRIEHAQHVRPQDFERFGKLGMVASMQPYHAIDDGRWAEKRIGHQRAASSYAWRSMLEAGAHLAFGTDWPVAPLNPLLGIYAAVTRATLDGKHPEGWFPEQKLNLEEALSAYTAGSAYAAFQEKEKGTISPGKLADMVVLSDDLFLIPPEKIKDAHVVLTLVGGRVVYQEK
ncbi:MAG TPA: amidohydrolase [Terriglobia bacterium]|nr:amidohydrolase [Terriglobia bacterium]